MEASKGVRLGLEFYIDGAQMLVRLSPVGEFIDVLGDMHIITRDQQLEAVTRLAVMEAERMRDHDEAEAARVRNNWFVKLINWRNK